jgi:TonB family protein
MSGIRGRWSLFLAATLLAASVAHADLAGAQKAYAAKDFEGAFQQYLAIATLGNLTAQENLAAMYVDGEGVTRDNVLGYAWAVIARENGGNAAMQNIIDQLQPHLDDKARARVKQVTDLYGKAALQQRLLPASLKYPTPRPDEDCRIEKPANPDDSYPGEARRQGISGSVLVASNIRTDGRVHNPQVVFSVPERVLDDAARLNVFTTTFVPKKVNGTSAPCAMRYLVRYRPLPPGADAAMDDATLKARKLAEAGDPVAQAVYALLLMDRSKLVRKDEIPFDWFLKSAQAGVPFAQFAVGSQLAGDGSMLPESEQVKGFAWLKLAAAAGQPDAKYALANYTLAHEPDGNRDPVVFAWLEDAAKAGHRDATLTLAALLAAGPDATRRDPARALDLLQSAKWDFSFDPTAQEVMAAAHAQSGRFTDALTAQKHALKLAKGYGWDAQALEQRLADYQSSKAWTGNLMLP